MVTIEKTNFPELTGRCKEDYNHIICGALTGKYQKGGYIVTSIIRLENQINEKKDSMFLISAQQYVEVEKLAEEKDEELLGFFYSTNRDIMHEPEIKYAIPGILYLAIFTKNLKSEVKAWRLNENRKKILPEKVEIEPELINLKSQLAVAV